MLSEVLSLDNFSFSQIWKIEKGRENEKVGKKEEQRATARDEKQRRRISLEEKHDNFVAVVRK